VHASVREGAVTARVTTLKGADAGAYYVEHLPRYYLDASGEPPGVWHGRGAALLGLSGSVRDGDFLDVMAGVAPGRGVLLGLAYGERAVRGFDVTASAPKSVSVLWAVGDDHVREEVLASHDAAVAGMIGWIERHAHTRYRVNGEVAVVDAEGVVAAAFRQHTSRALDPQLHSHVVIANRVRSDDGRWLALDARTIKVDQRTLSAVYHAGLRTELSRRLGVEWREPEHGIAEIAGVPDVVLADFSVRAEEVGDRLADKLDRFRHGMEREPTVRERWRLEREAVLESRPAKARAVEAGTLHDQWTIQLRELGWEPAELIRRATGQARERRVRPQDVERIMTDAMTALTEGQSTWRPAEVVRALAAAVPTWARFPSERLVPWLDDLAAEMTTRRMIDLSRPIPDGARLRRDGRPVNESALDRALTTNAILNEERGLVEWAYQRLLDGGRPLDDILNGPGVELTVGQAETAAAVAGNQELVLVVGPAGTGKTTALRPGIDQLHADGRAVFGVAPTAAAAQVLAEETGVDADTLDKLLVEHSLERPPRHRYDLPPGATVVVDEAAMISTPRLAELAALADQRHWRVALIGDPLQFSAVGRSGMFAHLVDTYGAVELDQVHRFTHEWERAASLRLRRGDTTVLDLYEQAGRIHGGDRREMEQEMLTAWAQARAAGETVAMLAPTNDTVVRLNQLAQRQRIADGDLIRGRSVTAGPYGIHAGDEIATRQNQRDLQTDQQRSVKNRDQWTVDAVHRNGSLTVTGPTGTVQLPGDYVARHVELAYAQTSHAAQGRTLDRSLLLVDGPTDCRGIYVPMTRGRHGNDMFVVTDGDRSARDVLDGALAQNWIDVPAVVRQAELARPTDRPVDRRRIDPLSAPELRRLLETEQRLAGQITGHHQHVERIAHQLARAQDNHTRTLKDLRNATVRRDEAQATLRQYDRPFHRRHHLEQIHDARRTLAVTDDIPKLEARVRELSAEIRALERQSRQLDRQAPDRSRWAAELAQVRGELADDLTLRTRRAPREAGAEAVIQLGARPTDRDAARLWDTAAARLDQHYAAFPEMGGRHLARSDEWVEPACQTSRQRTDHAIARLDQGARTPAREAGVEQSLDLGISM
jgi:conjugative relaxase-like TrwC/TraI family protein